MRDGLHIASLAGTWIAFVNGFGGMCDHGGVLSFAPRLPDGIASLCFSIVRRGLRLRVEIGERSAICRLTGGDGELRLLHHGEAVVLSGQDPVERAIPPRRPRTPPEQPGRAPQQRSPG